MIYAPISPLYNFYPSVRAGLQTEHVLFDRKVLGKISGEIDPLLVNPPKTFMIVWIVGLLAD